MEAVCSEDINHLLIFSQHVTFKGCDSVIEGCIRQVLHELGTDTLALIRVLDNKVYLCRVCAGKPVISSDGHYFFALLFRYFSDKGKGINIVYRAEASGILQAHLFRNMVEAQVLSTCAQSGKKGNESISIINSYWSQQDT